MGDINLIKIWEKNIFLSENILASKWPCFAVPIHMCHPVEQHICMSCYSTLTELLLKKGKPMRKNWFWLLES